MITVYAETAEEVGFTFTDADGAALDITASTTSVILADIGDFPIVATAVTGYGIATLADTDISSDDPPIVRYQVFLDGVVTEEGLCLIRPKLDATADEVS